MRTEVKNGAPAYDSLFIVDSSGNPVEGLTEADFAIRLYNPNNVEVHASIIVTISELDLGLYRVEFAPNMVGLWTLLIYHAMYFPIGKIADYYCVDNLGDDLAEIMILLKTFVTNKRFLQKRGSTWYLVIRDATDNADILRKAIKDRNGNDLLDSELGSLALEEQSSV